MNGATAELRNLELEEAIRRDPADLDAYEVYADWLLERGEPHGELILFAVRRRRDGATDDFAVLAAEARLQSDRRRMFGELGSLPRHLVECDLELGFIRSLRIYAKGDEAGLALRHAFTHRSGALLRDVSVEQKAHHLPPHVSEHRATTRAVWETLFEVGVPSTVETVALPLLGDDLRAAFEVLAHVRRCTFPLRQISAIATHVGTLGALESLTLTVSGRASELMVERLVDSAGALAAIPRIVLAFVPPYSYELKALREALPQVEIGWHS